MNIQNLEVTFNVYIENRREEFNESVKKIQNMAYTDYQVLCSKLRVNPTGIRITLTELSDTLWAVDIKPTHIIGLFIDIGGYSLEEEYILTNPMGQQIFRGTEEEAAEYCKEYMNLSDEVFNSKIGTWEVNQFDKYKRWIESAPPLFAVISFNPLPEGV